MENKDLSKASIEDLIKLASNQLELSHDKRLESTLGPVNYFIISDGLKSGTEKIPAYHIYDRYVKWVKNQGTVDLLSLRDFFVEFKKFFKKHIKPEGMHYILSPEGFNMSPQALQESRAKYSIRKSGNDKIKSKEEKKQSKIKKTTYQE